MNIDKIIIKVILLMFGGGLIGIGIDQAAHTSYWAAIGGGIGILVAFMFCYLDGDFN